MTIINIIPSQRFRGHWVACEMEGVEPAFPSKEQAIGYARDCRFGGTKGEIHVYDDIGENILQAVRVDGGDISSPRANISANESEGRELFGLELGGGRRIE